jgi:negative regulator of flagellin synthesis FlgM
MIDPLKSSALGPARLDRSRPADAASAAARQPRADTPAAERAPSLSALLGQLAADGPPIDSARVADLRAAISAGDYVVQPARIAAAMLASEDAG